MKSFRIATVFFLAILLLNGCSITSTPTTTTTTIAGCSIGAFVNGLNNTPTFETAIGKNLAINMWYIDWNTSFPAADCTTVDNYGGVPMLTWEPYLNTTNTLDAIANGSYDAYITTFANAAKSWNKLVYLRFAHEMNGNWYPWDGYHNGGSSGPAKYIAAWRHIHDIFTNAGATNVKWVWSINNSNSPGDSWNAAENYYPGSSYVDWIGIDGYNWGTSQSWSAWQTFDTVFNSAYSTFSSYGKPMMIAEFASTENGGNKAAWITDAFSKIKNNYPLITIFNWFNIDKTSAGETDWRINSSANSENVFKAAVSDTYFKETKPTN